MRIARRLRNNRSAISLVTSVYCHRRLVTDAHDRLIWVAPQVRISVEVMVSVARENISFPIFHNTRPR